MKKVFFILGVCKFLFCGNLMAQISEMTSFSVRGGCAPDLDAPIITGCPGNVSASVNSACQFIIPNYSSMVFVSDNCTSPPMISISQMPAPSTALSLGTTSVTITATDDAGNMSSCSFNLIVSDVTAPSITSCPSNQAVIADTSCSFVLADYTALIAVSDNCTSSPLISITQIPVQSTALTLGITTITITAVDEAGNSSACTFDISVIDTLPPVFLDSLPSQYVDADTNGNYVLVDFMDSIIVSDNCSSRAILISQSPVSGTNLGVGTTTVNLTATDDEGNSSSLDFDVIVESTVGVDEARNISESDLFLFPNPVSDGLNIHAKNMTGLISYSIYDISGAKVGEGSLQTEKGDVMKINFSNFESGLYQLVFHKEDGTFVSRKIAVTHQ